MAERLRAFTFRGRLIVRPVFIETGTFRGETLANAMFAGFGTLHSIEVCEANYQIVKAQFRQYHNVHLHLGSSPEVLPRIIDDQIPTTFWLDAHYQGLSRAEQDEAYGECPLLAELDVIFGYQWSPVVLIDDAHMFDHRFPPGFDRVQWPSRQQIRDAVPSHYNVVEEDGVLYCIDSREGW